MFLLPVFDHFVNALVALVNEAEKAVSEATDAYALASVSLAVTGVSEVQVYQAVPEMHPRTVRRVLAGRKDTVRMCMSSFSGEEQVHKDSISETVLDGIRSEAEKAGVAPGVAESAVTRYGNTPERVQRVLEGIQTLLEASCKVYNPSGLFTRLMRSGGEVKLPERVTQARKQVEEKRTEEAAKPVPAVGMLIKFCGEVCRIVELMRQFVVVENDEGVMMNVSRDNLRFVTP